MWSRPVFESIYFSLHYIYKGGCRINFAARHDLLATSEQWDRYIDRFVRKYMFFYLVEMRYWENRSSIVHSKQNYEKPKIYGPSLPAGLVKKFRKIKIRNY